MASSIANDPDFVPSPTTDSDDSGPLQCLGFVTQTINGSTFRLVTSVPTSEATQPGIVCAPNLFPTADGDDDDGPTPTTSPTPASTVAGDSDGPDFTPTASPISISIGGPGLVTVTITSTNNGLSPVPTDSGSTISSTNVTHNRNVTGPVVGSIVGALAAALILGLMFVLYKRRRQARAKHTWVRAGKWSFNDRRPGDSPHEMHATSPT